MSKCPKCGSRRIIRQKDQAICDECGWIGKEEDLKRS